MEMTDILKKHFDAVEAKFGTLPEQVKEALIRLQDLEQKQSRASYYGGSGNARETTWGEQFVEAEELKTFADDHSRPRRFRMELKTTITTGGTSGGPLGNPTYRDSIDPMPRRRLRVRDLLPVVGISTGAVEYPKQTTRTNNANTLATVM